MELKKTNTLPKSCQKAAEFSDKQQYDEASFWEKWRVQIHILHCKYCHTYHYKNMELTELLKKHQFQLLSKSEKEELNAKLFL